MSDQQKNRINLLEKDNARFKKENEEERARHISIEEFLVKKAKKEQSKLQERINRINKLTPGLQRLYNLDRIIMELKMEADNLEDGDGLRKDALYLERLEWDLHRLNEAVKDRLARNGGTPSDPGHWRGERP